MAHASIISRIPASFDKARDAGDLLFFNSTIVRHNENEVDYEIRLCPAVQNKPALPTPHFNAATDGGSAFHSLQGKAFDPFLPPYNQNLYVDELKDEENQEDFVVLLNKFSVVPHHFLLVTKEFKSQASPLTPPELVQTYLLLAAAKRVGRKFFAFYNCGENSGASQFHKHIQFIPIEDETGPPIEQLARRAQIEIPGRPFALTKLSYASHTFRFPSYFETYSADDMEPILARAFIQLLDLTISTIRHDDDYPVGPPSYNVILTLEHIHFIPRCRENYILPESGERLAVNALGFAGMMLVKSEEELEMVKKESISKILRGVGLESVHDIQVGGTSVEAPISGLH